MPIDSLAMLKCESLNEECDAKNEKEWTSLNELNTGYAAEWAICMAEWATQLSDRLFWLSGMGTAFLAELNGDGFFGWFEWGRLFRLSWMGTAFSAGLNGNGFFKGVGWERLFWLGWMGTAFSAGLGFFGWVEWERLFRLGWMGTAFSDGLNENGFLSVSTQVWDGQ